MQRLSAIGLQEGFVRATLAPSPGADPAIGAESAEARTRRMIARQFSLRPSSVMDDSRPLAFEERVDAVRTLVPGLGYPIVAGYLLAVCEAVHGCIGPWEQRDALPARSLRERMLLRGSYVSREAILQECWSLGFPVVQLQICPVQFYGITCLPLRVAGRWMILLSSDAAWPAQVADRIALCLGQIFHASEHEGRPPPQDDPRCRAFASKVLTGMTHLSVTGALTAETRDPTQLAQRAEELGARLRVHPAHLILLFAQTTGMWLPAETAMEVWAGQSPEENGSVNAELWDRVRRRAQDQDVVGFLRAAIRP